MTIRQDFADAVRPVFFQTEYDDFLYATDGGTLFVVRYRDRDYGVTCRHVFTGNGFDPNRLFITRKSTQKRAVCQRRSKAWLTKPPYATRQAAGIFLTCA